MAFKQSRAPAFGSLGQTQGSGRSGPPLTSAQDMNSSSHLGSLNQGGKEHEPPPMEGESGEPVLVDLAAVKEPPAPGSSFQLSS